MLEMPAMIHDGGKRERLEVRLQASALPIFNPAHDGRGLHSKYCPWYK